MRNRVNPVGPIGSNARTYRSIAIGYTIIAMPIHDGIFPLILFGKAERPPYMNIDLIRINFTVQVCTRMNADHVR